MAAFWCPWRKPGGKLLTASATVFLLTLLCGFTPLVWILQGQPEESYPELFFIFTVLPVAFVGLSIAIIRFLLLNRKSVRV